MRLRSRCLAIILLGVVYMPTAAAKVLSARVDDLGDLIQIVLMFERQSLIPLHPDRGFFPKIRSEDRFVAWGEGQMVRLHGHTYRRFEIGRDIRSVPDHCVYRSGEVLISEADGEVIIHASLSDSHSRYTNPSGRYRDVEFTHQELATLPAGTDLHALRDHYVEATGRFDHENRLFVVDGNAYPAMDLCSNTGDQSVKVLAHVLVPRGESPPYLFVLRKGEQIGPMCCPWGE